VGREDAIVAAARRRFALEGFDATTLSGVAADAGLSLAALYHYVKNKFELYELVFRATMTQTWETIGKRVAELEQTPKLTDRVEGLLDAITTQHFSIEVNGFLSAAPLEFLRHPELAHLREERERVRQEVLRSVVEPVYAEGVFGRCRDLDHATRTLELIFTGWAMEAFFRPSEQDELSAILLEVTRMLDGEQAAAKRPGPKRARKTDSSKRS
jgi:AcrR family transcriptional regulator